MRRSYRELQSFVEQAVSLAVQEGVGASRLGYSYSGQAGFLQRAQTIRASASACTELLRQNDRASF